MNLFEIGAQHRALVAQLENLLEELNGDITDPEIASLIDEWFTGNDESLKEKLDGYCAIIGEQKAMAAARLEESKRIAGLASQNTALVTKLGERLKYFFESQGLTKVETPRYKLSIVNNGGKCSLVTPDDLDPTTLPATMQRVIPARIEADKEAIREALERGTPVPGFSIAPRGTRLAIK
jgi:hypothetical protein